MRIPFFNRRRRTVTEIAPDEIFLDSRNLPEFDQSQMEGRLERPIGTRVITIFGGTVLVIGLVLLGRLSMLQIVHGQEYATRSEENRLEKNVVFARRGVLYDRRGTELAWNIEDASSTLTSRA